MCAIDATNDGIERRLREIETLSGHPERARRRIANQREDD